MPNNEVMAWTTKLVSWLMWYEWVRDQMGRFDSECPDYVQDDKTMFLNWVKGQEKRQNDKYK